MILIDFNQIMIASIMQQIHQDKNAELDEELIRHMSLNSIRSNNSKFRRKYGEFILCADDSNNWRKDHFSLYKANRKKDRETSTIDWDQLFTILNKIRDELRDNFPFKVIRVARAEADDVIASFCHKFGSPGIVRKDSEPILIVSSDKDFAQLQKYANVEQYNPVKKQYITIPNPERNKFELIIKGDKGDGVPNYLSPEDTLVTGGRQKSIFQKHIDECNGKPPEEFCLDKEGKFDEFRYNRFKLNQMMVDLDFVPHDIQDETISQYENYKLPGEPLIKYFIQHKLKNLSESIGDFYAS